MNQSNNSNLPAPAPGSSGIPGSPRAAAPFALPPRDYQALYFSELLKRQVCIGQIKNKIGDLTDLAVKVIDPYAEVVGFLMDVGWGAHGQFVPWAKVVKIDNDAIFVNPPDTGDRFPPFVDQPGWLLVNEHLMGRTILDIDGRRIEVVNDVHLLESKGRMLVVHVDVSFHGFLRKWGLKWLSFGKDKLISWKYVQPLSLEDAVKTDAVSLSVTRKQVQEMPGEDLADALEELSGKEQQAFFSALDSDKAAEALIQAEPRTQRQLITDLRKEKARTILSEMSVPQLADLLSVLPHEDQTKMMALLPPAQADRIKAIISDREATAGEMMSAQFVASTKDVTVGQILAEIRASKRAHEAVSYVYILNAEDKVLQGVVDLRDLVLATDTAPLSELMASPVVSAEADFFREDLAELFAKYHYRMIPVVDHQDHMLGVIHYNDIMKGLVTRAKI